MRAETRAKLEALSRSSDSSTRDIARRALGTNGRPYELPGWDYVEDQS